MRYFIYLAYDGTNYHGWQIQPNGASVQETLMKSLSTFLRRDIEIVGAGRTDAGVHAKLMVAHFDSEIILDETFDSEHFYIGEGMIPSGNWSGYPPHRHDYDDLPGEIDMEETYFYRFDPQQGFGIQKVYQPDGSIDETYTVKYNDTVAIAEGYHPLCGAPGYQMYYLWTMAGAQGRGLVSSMDPAHAWVKNS